MWIFDLYWNALLLLGFSAASFQLSYWKAPTILSKKSFLEFVKNRVLNKVADKDT